MSDLRHQLIGEDRLVAAVRPCHPLTDGPLAAQRYAAAEHITVSRRGRLRDPVDDVLTALGLQRQVIASAPSSAIALQLVLDADLVVTVPEAATTPALLRLGLQALPLPFPMPPIPLHLSRHQRHAHDPAHTWLRTQAHAALQTVFRQPDPAF
ncbi:hypothetical protein SY2F82_11940 [Streptomyces sp. Y2F8-2]|uniref:LysR substrate-binding domain-containing protein n=1 Tax=Streptomyces sp. Y2F8-2 TaxID=2759675 RepID=UPI001A3C3CB6|nr:LysR substrate-binding domain-containing protein [Streptomyces sp. Y2F8-2]GHJ99396.1 hypothetical protein SY2F82_11940 [Streptomyces sp. Y2F8-2]